MGDREPGWCDEVERVVEYRSEYRDRQQGQCIAEINRLQPLIDRLDVLNQVRAPLKNVFVNPVLDRLLVA